MTVSGQRERTRRSAAPNRHRQTKRNYRLRSYVHCGSCSRRLGGRAPHGRAYYVCRPPARRPTATHRVSEFRRTAWSTACTPSSPIASSDRTARRCWPSRAERRGHANELTATLRTLEESQDPTPAPELLDALPVTGPDLARVSDERARALFDAFGLEITYDKPTHTARCRTTLTADILPRAVAAAAGDHAAMWVVPSTGFEPDGCGGAGGRLVVEATLGIQDSCR